MKKIILLLVITFLSIVSKGQEFPLLKGPYLGQRLPGTTPEIFAPGIVSTGVYTRDIAIAKDGKEIYFCVADASVTAIFVSRCIDNQWTEPVIASFSGKGFLDMEPSFSPDDNKIYFLSNRPPKGLEPKKGWFYQKIWVTERKGSEWSEPQLVEEPVNSDEYEFFPSVVDNNSLYFTRMSKNGTSSIYKSRFVNNRFDGPELISLNVPENGVLFNAFVSPTEDYLITCAQNIDSTNIDQDYYISFRDVSGAWGKLIKFGPELNSPGDNANSAYVSPDGKFLFFSSSRRDSASLKIESGTQLKEIANAKLKPGNGTSSIYWVSAKIIDDLRPGK
jgi:hypothetical protein